MDFKVLILILLDVSLGASQYGLSMCFTMSLNPYSTGC